MNLRSSQAGFVDAVERSQAAWLRRRLFGNTSLVIGGSIVLLIVLMAIFAPLLAPHDPYLHDLSRRLQPPLFYDGHNLNHPLGTDPVGRDYLSRLIYGSRISLLIGFSVMLISGFIGTALGLAAGYHGGRVDQVIMFIINTRLALPVFLVTMSVVVVFGASMTAVIMTLGLLLWDRFAVVIRSVTQQARAQDYVTAARSIGCSSAYIVVHEILPNLSNALIVIGTIEMANAILLEAALSFLGFGMQEPTPSWGLMLSQARQYMFFDAWLLAIPGIALFTLVLAINLFGDGLRDVFGMGSRG